MKVGAHRAARGARHPEARARRVRPGAWFLTLRPTVRGWFLTLRPTVRGWFLTLRPIARAGT
ncbi:hypothetical protein [Longispora urticae]